MNDNNFRLLARVGLDDHYIGRYDYRLRQVDEMALICHKCGVMDVTGLRPAGEVSIVL